MIENIEFVPKRIKGDIKPWVRFGSTRAEYDLWSPEVCGICCLKMVGDTFNKTNQMSLYSLTMQCLDKGGYRILADNRIEGVFHQPLLALAEELGLQGEVRGNLDPGSVIKALGEEKLVILSIDLKKVRPELNGGHLILIYDYSRSLNSFFAHDPSYLLSRQGRGTRVDSEYLEDISNQKGIVLWP